MINLRDMLTEDRSKSSTQLGCLMAMLTKEDCDSINAFSKKLIKDEDLYIEGTEYGREKESHVTIRYGFTRDLNELEIRSLLKGIKPFLVELVALDAFTTPPQFDVIIFKAKSSVLNHLHEQTDVYPNTTDFPDYKPHLTIAYTKKNTHPNIKRPLTLVVRINTICYSPISGGKSYFKLNDD